MADDNKTAQDQAKVTDLDTLRRELQERRRTADWLEGMRADLPPGEPLEQVHAILDRPDAEGFVQSLNPQVLYRLIFEAGWEAGHDLVPLASPWQVQVFCDFDCWAKDRFVPQQLDKWLATLVLEADDATFKRDCRDTDPELLALYVKANLEVDLPGEEGEIPAHLANRDFTTSPDGQYIIVFPEDEERAALMRAFLDRLYDVDRVLAWTLLEAARWELYSTMEEDAYHWRNSRLEEFGFVSPDEALEIYAFRDPNGLRAKIERDPEALQPKQIRAGATPDLPVLLQDATEEDFYVLARMEAIEEPEIRDRLASEFAAVQNRTLIADGVDQANLHQARGIARRTVGYLSLGLEFLSRKDDEAADRILRTVALKEVFRAGFSLCWKLRGQVVQMSRRPALSIVEGERFSLLSADDAATCDALLRPRPEFSLQAETREIFRTTDQLDQVALRLGLIAFKQVWLFAVKGVKPAELIDLAYGDKLLNPPPSVTLDAIFATTIALGLLSGESNVRGLSREELDRLPELMASPPWGEEIRTFFGPLIDPMLAQLPPGSSTLAMRWLEAVIDRLEEEFAAVTEIEEPAYFQDVVLIAADAG